MLRHIVYRPPKLEQISRDLEYLTGEAFAHRYKSKHVLVGGSRNLDVSDKNLLAGRTIAGDWKQAEWYCSIDLDSWVYFFDLPDPDPNPYALAVLGRAANCNVIVPRDNPEVSNCHAFIRRNPGDEFFLIDQSRNGTYLDDKKITKERPVKLEYGNTIGLGSRVKLMFLTPQLLHSLTKKMRIFKNEKRNIS